MSYTITLTNGTILTTLIDGTLDDTTDLTLIGKNFTGYGEQLNENFVKLLENFAGVSQPAKPVVGQLWYDATDQRMKVYSLTGWRVAGGPLVTDIEPLSFNTGDLWIDNSEDQMYFFTGSDLILAGPTWKKSQGKTGFVAETLFDSSGNSKPVLMLYVRNSLLGIYSSEQFVPVPTLAGFPVLYKGYTSNNQIASIFLGNAASAATLDGLSPSQFMRSDQSTSNSQQILIQNNKGLSVGSNQIGNFRVDGSSLLVENVALSGTIALKTQNTTGNYYPIYVDGGSNRIGMFTVTPQATLDVAGDLRIRGNFVVEGTNSIIDSTVLNVENKTINLATVTNPTDLTANGAGIVIKGTTDKTILYNSQYNTMIFSTNIGLVSGNGIGIGSTPVLTETALLVSSAPNLTSIGRLTSLSVSDLTFSSNRISSASTNQDIELSPLGTGNIVLIDSPRITGLGNPINDSDAANKYYVSNLFAVSLPLSVSLIDNGLTGNINANTVKFLTDIAPPAGFPPGKVAYVHLQNIGAGSPPTITRYLKKFQIQNNVWVFDSDLTSSI